MNSVLHPVHHGGRVSTTDVLLRATRRHLDLEENLLARGAGFDGPLARLRDLSRSADLLAPSAFSALSERLDQVRNTFEDVEREQPIDTLQLSEAVLVPHLEAGIPLRRHREGASWAREALERRLEHFEQSDVVRAAIDISGERHRGPNDRVETLARLAVGAGWLGWSDLLVDGPSSRRQLQRLSRLLDRAERTLGQAETDPDRQTLGWLLGALSLEKRLLRHWRIGKRETA